MKDLSIIIVSYNTKELMLQCLDSIFSSKVNFSYEVIVVDNASRDDSIEAIRKKYPVGENNLSRAKSKDHHSLKIIQRSTNDGFAVANNRGVAAAEGKYVWLLNSDTVIFDDTIEKLMNDAIKHNICIASCKLLNPDKSIQPQGGALPSNLNLFSWMLNIDSIPFISRIIPPYQERRISKFVRAYCNTPLQWVGGTALLVRRDVYESMGGLDENIFMYGEDVEFCLRAHQGHMPVYYFPEAALIHYGQQSGSKERSILGEFQGLKYISQKHKTAIEYNWLRFVLKLGSALRFCAFAIKGNNIQRDIYAKAFKMA